MLINNDNVSAIVGVSGGILVLIILRFFNKKDKSTMLGLILAGIGFLYVGYTWSDIPSLIITSVQAILFTLLALFGIKRNVKILAAGYFLHGCWDIAYPFFNKPGLVPPHYDVFCSTLDFIIGIYILVINK